MNLMSPVTENAFPDLCVSILSNMLEETTTSGSQPSGRSANKGPTSRSKSFEGRVRETFSKVSYVASSQAGIG